jgi:hypothetical protein
MWPLPPPPYTSDINPNSQVETSLAEETDGTEGHLVGMHKAEVPSMMNDSDGDEWEDVGTPAHTQRSPLHPHAARRLCPVAESEITCLAEHPLPCIREALARGLVEFGNCHMGWGGDVM